MKFGDVPPSEMVRLRNIESKNAELRQLPIALPASDSSNRVRDAYWDRTGDRALATPLQRPAPLMSNMHSVAQLKAVHQLHQDTFDNLRRLRQRQVIRSAERQRDLDVG